MAIDQHGATELLVRPLNEAAQLRMIGLVIAVDARLRFLEGDFLGVDLLAVAHHARNRPETRCYARASAVDELRQRPIEHGRVELIRFPVGINESARKM